MEGSPEVTAMVSKRSARTFAEDGGEHKPFEYEAKRYSRGEEGLSLGDIDTVGNTSSRSSSEVSSLWSGSERMGVDLGVDLTDVLGREGQGVLSLKLEKGELTDFNKAQPPYSVVDSEYTHVAGEKPHNFGLVVPGIYRSSFPQPANYGFVQGLQLKTIVTLVDKGPLESYDSFIAKNGIAHHVFSMKGTKKESIPIETMKSILRLVLDRQHHPLLIHCNHGKHRTGCVVAVVRKITGWEDSVVVDEYKAFADAKARECDVQYINDFQVAHLSNLFVTKRANAKHRASGFLRATAFSIVLVLIWMLSGTKLGRQSERRRNMET